MEMKKNPRNKNQRILFLTFLFMFILSSVVFGDAILKRDTVTKLLNENSTQFKTSYDYQAVIKPNILYPNGETIEGGNTIFGKITTVIPVHLNSSVTTEKKVTVEGTHEVQMVIKAGDFWEKSFPLEKKQDFKKEGTNIAFVNNDYTIDLQKVQSFITQVENETGINSEQYTVEILPNIQGSIIYNNEKRAIQIQDLLKFQYDYGNLKLDGEKEFTSTTPFTSTMQSVHNTYHIMGYNLPLIPIRIISGFMVFLFLVFLIVQYKDKWVHRDKQPYDKYDKINKKYKSRMIPVSKKINITQKANITLDSISSLIRLADERELPIFFIDEKGSLFYFILDGDYLYSFEPNQLNFSQVMEKEIGSEKVYARG
jgi:hypothetical protein